MSSAPEDSSIVFPALMRARAQWRKGLDEAITRALTSDSLTLLHTFCKSCTTCGEIEFICPLASHAIATPSERVSSFMTSTFDDDAAGCSAPGWGEAERRSGVRGKRA